ncbi:MAG: ATP synthase subunit gamma [Pirellulaceae bacterium]|nr:MAG: ATP synthase subunit gamma [Pirellulaceae bacterium]
METPESLKRRIRTAEELQSLVRTMKALAAVNMRQLENALQALDDFHRTIQMGLHVVLRRHDRQPWAARTAPRHRSGLIAFGSDQGMCGQLNDQVAAYAHAWLRHDPSTPEVTRWLAVGFRVAARLEDFGHTVDSVLKAPASVSGITPVVQQLLVELDRWLSEYQIDRVVVFHAELVTRASYEPRAVELLPLDRVWLDQIRQVPWPTHLLPAFTLPADQLFSALVRQHLFVSLYRACGQSQASENAARLATMRGAERNVADRIVELTHAFHQIRQMAITEELLDIVSGFEALAGASPIS